MLLFLMCAILPLELLAQQCDPMTTPVFVGNVSSPKEVLGIDLGDRKVSAEEIEKLMVSIASESPRVIMDSLAVTSVQGRPLYYALVSAPENLEENALAKIRYNTELLRNPKTSSNDAYLLAQQTPAIVWITANIHGNEPSGCDAALQLLWHMSDRIDCAAEQILKNVLLIILPTQNPDGREANTRRNANGFDMNRDWFAQTQPETDGKMRLVQQYLPALFIDAHEMGGTSFFFPPYADPLYHNVPENTIDWVNNIYGAALAAEFNRQDIPFYNFASFDQFFPGYGSSFHASAFMAADILFEKGGSAEFSAKVYEQFLCQWVSASQAAINRVSVQVTLHGSIVRAKDMGEAGQLQPNLVYNPGHEVEFEVPDIRVRSYFLLNNDTDKASEVLYVLQRLWKLGIEIEILTTSLSVLDYTPYGRNARVAMLPAGTYVINMAQGQNHAIQTMLCEGTYVPFRFFYDATGWSSPILENIPGGYSGEKLQYDAKIMTPIENNNVDNFQLTGLVGISVLKPSATNPGESFEHALFTLTKWGVEYTILLPSEIKDKINGFNLLIVPSLSNVNSVFDSLGDDGVKALGDWVDLGGNYFGWGGGAVLASRVGLSRSHFSTSSVDSPGAMFRIVVPESVSSRLTLGIGKYDYLFYSSAMIMQTPGAHVIAEFPPADSEDWYVHGFQVGGEEELAGSTAVAEEFIGLGRVVLVSSRINFRAFTGGSAKFLFNMLSTFRNSTKINKNNYQVDDDDSMRNIAAEMTRKALQNVVVQPLRIAIWGIHTEEAEKKNHQCSSNIGIK